jgi:hypothetical protein
VTRGKENWQGTPPIYCCESDEHDAGTAVVQLTANTGCSSSGSDGGGASALCMVQLMYTASGVATVSSWCTCITGSSSCCCGGCRRLQLPQSWAVVDAVWCMCDVAAVMQGVEGAEEDSSSSSSTGSSGSGLDSLLSN